MNESKSTSELRWEALKDAWRRLRPLLIISGPLLMVLLIRHLVKLEEPNQGIIAIQPGALADPVKLAGCCALVAFLTSALLQIWKEQGDMRANVHRSAVEDWLTQRYKARYPKFVNSSEGTKGSHSLEWTTAEPPIESANAEMERLCAAGSSEPAFYNLPTEQFCGQIATAVELVLMAPRSYPHFFAALTSGDDAQHQSAVESFVTSEPRSEKSSGKAALKPIDPDEYDRLRARVSNYAQRALDGLQLEAVRQWKRRVLGEGFQFSLGFSLAIAAVVAWPQDSTLIGQLKFLFATMVCAIAGTLLAPVAHDLTSAIRAFGKR